MKTLATIGVVLLLVTFIAHPKLIDDVTVFAQDAIGVAHR